jgi:N-acetylmuramoyl-L-alanine amidase
MSPSPTPTPAEQRITDISVTDIPNGGTRLTLTLSGGPVSFEWHRLADPDNRYWLDIKGVTLAGPSQTFISGLPFVKEIHVTQFELDPERIVRVAIDPTQPIDVNVGPVAQSGNQMGVEIEREPPAEDAPRAGIGAIAFAVATPAPRTPTQRDLVVIDPGHGGNDPGASNNAYGLTEANLTLTISLKLRDYLRRMGWRVVMTRDGDYEVGDPKGDDHQELQARCDVANSAGARVFVSVHINSSVAHSLNGTTTYYWRRTDKAFAQAVQSAVVMADGISDAGVKRNDFYVIKNTTMPAILVETAFLSNSRDAELLSHADFLDKLAQGIANGVMNFTGGPNAPL